MGMSTILGMVTTSDCDPYPKAMNEDCLNWCWTNIIFFDIIQIYLSIGYGYLMVVLFSIHSMHRVSAQNPHP